MTPVYYNEINPWCCDVLRARTADGLLPSGQVDERDIGDIQPDELHGFRHAHFFAGIGGFPLGLKWADWPADLPVWTGGFPCQDISTAGKGAGLAGARSGLWWTWFELIRAVRPPCVLIENVPALRLRGADEVMAALEAEDYACRAFVVGAWAVGAPHKRDRVWIVADHPPSGQRPGDGDASGRSGGFVVEGSGTGRNPDDSGKGVADRPRQHGEQRPDGNGTGAGGGQGLADAAELRRSGLQPQSGSTGTGQDEGRLSQPTGMGTRWPARPGEPQHEWEAPRLADTSRQRRQQESGSPHGDEATHEGRTPADDHQPTGDGQDDRAKGQPQPRLGPATHGLPRRLAGRERKHRLKALGNAVVPQVVEIVARAILENHDRTDFA